MTEPIRPLGTFGREAWDRIWANATYERTPEPLIQLVQLVCEQMDERQALRRKVLSNEPQWRDRAALRAIDAQIAEIFLRLSEKVADDYVEDVFKDLLAEMGDAT